MNIKQIPIRLEPTQCQYAGQNQRQPVVVDIEPDLIRVHYNAELGNAVPVAVWNGTVQRLTLGPLPRYVVKAWLTVHRDDLRKIAAGLSDHWDGSNMVGDLTEDATELLESLEDEIWNGEALKLAQQQ